MKFITQTAEFKPVTLILESQNEVNWLYELTGIIGGGGKARSFFDEIYYALENEVPDHQKDCKVFEEIGSLQLKAKY